MQLMWPLPPPPHTHTCDTIISVRSCEPDSPEGILKIQWPCRDWRRKMRRQDAVKAAHLPDRGDPFPNLGRSSRIGEGAQDGRTHQSALHRRIAGPAIWRVHGQVESFAQRQKDGLQDCLWPEVGLCQGGSVKI
eukprot:scaffold100581_cov31-Tisochrysis_lutea.AAC.3